ncbi:secretory lipase-domain-containing protein [Kockovaella imperatae]|uniref:triacylglycerol lipase n=1 Tax=Kockovaella imperatae TaxID=4999 RepID=A0A1Y1UFX6_9TREE|nr:secretory lipase-domain-containing protein [Kockovaella imperatae]ORX36970.1 secretory lipase-domain-containing protein [Kockovaella imperatae]
MILPYLLQTLWATASALPVTGLFARGGQASPLDPFYISPGNVQGSPLGTVLRSRTFQPIYNDRPLNATGYQLLYVTQGANTTKFAATTTIFKPTQPNGNLITYAEPYDADSTACAPSAAYLGGGWSTTSDDETLYMIGFLDQGYIVNSPDYEGPDSAYSAGILSGHAVLDSVRAVLSYGPIGLNANTQVAGVGYSGGAIATGWAAALHASYAPSINVVAWSVGGTPADLLACIQNLDGGPYARLAIGGIFGQSQAYQAIADLLSASLTSIGLSARNTTFNGCKSPTVALDFAFQHFLSTEYQSYGSQLVYQPAFAGPLSQQLLGQDPNLVPVAPIRVFHALHDEVIPYATVQKMVNSWCANGIKSLIFETDEGASEHGTEEILQLANVFNWVNSRMNGTAPPVGCQITTTVLPLLDAGALPAAVSWAAGIANTLITSNTTPVD